MRSSRSQLPRSLSEPPKDLPLSVSSSARGGSRRHSEDHFIPQVNDPIIGAKFDDVPQGQLYESQGGLTNQHFHMSKPTRTIRGSCFEGGGMLEREHPRRANTSASINIKPADLVCDSYHFEEGMPWMFSKSKGFGQNDYIAKRRLRKWGEFSHGPSLRYVIQEENNKPLYRYHRAVSAPPQMSGERHAASLLGSVVILDPRTGCKDTWESWKPSKKTGSNFMYSSREVADAVRNSEIHDYEKNFKKRIKSDPKFAQLCKDTASWHEEAKKTSQNLQRKWANSSIGALLKPDEHS